MACGSDVERHVAGIREFETAGFTHVASVQVGGDSQEQFISWAAAQLSPALRVHASARPPTPRGIAPTSKARSTAPPSIALWPPLRKTHSLLPSTSGWLKSRNAICPFGKTNYARSASTRGL